MQIVQDECPPGSRVKILLEGKRIQFQVSVPQAVTPAS
jgi:hypothetical protein